MRAIWESLDMNRTMAIQNGMAYTHIGNQGRSVADARPGPRTPPTLR